MSLQHPQGAVMELTQNLSAELANCPIILCCAKWSVIFEFGILKALAVKLSLLGSEVKYYH
jgi:hypothetical protein